MGHLRYGLPLRQSNILGEVDYLRVIDVYSAGDDWIVILVVRAAPSFSSAVLVRIP